MYNKNALQFTGVQIKWYQLLSLFHTLGADLDIPNYPFGGQHDNIVAKKFARVYIQQPTLDAWLANESKIPHSERCQSQGETKPVPDEGVQHKTSGKE